MTFIRQLTGHSAPLAAIDINDLTGDVATCSGTWLHLWSINGEPLASVNTLVGAGGGNAGGGAGGGRSGSQHILCVCFSQYNEWDPANVILTGSTDGVVRMWSLDYVQVPDELATKKVEEPLRSPLPSQPTERADQPEEEGSDSDEEDSAGREDREGQEDSARKSKPANKHQPLERQASVNSNTSSLDEGENRAGPDAKEETGQPIKKEEGEEEEEGETGLRSSRSDSSLNGTFEVITESEVRESRTAAAQQQTSTPLTPTAASSARPSPASVPVKKSRHVLKEGYYSFIFFPESKLLTHK